MLKSRQTPRRLDREAAETIAAQGLAFLAGEPQRLGRFLAMTGLTAEDLKARAAHRELLAAVLSFYAADESLLLAFAAARDVAPEAIGAALSALDAPDAD